MEFINVVKKKYAKVTDTNDGCRVLDASARLLPRALASQSAAESLCNKLFIYFKREADVICVYLRQPPSFVTVTLEVHHFRGGGGFLAQFRQGQYHDSITLIVRLVIFASVIAETRTMGAVARFLPSGGVGGT
jgi:hypothetical protein